MRRVAASALVAAALPGVIGFAGGSATAGAFSRPGLPVEYQMLRGIFTTKNAKPEQVAFYVDLLQKVMATPDWKEFMEKGAFNQTTMEGEAFFNWLGKAEQMHRELMKDAGFMAK